MNKERKYRALIKFTKDYIRYHERNWVLVMDVEMYVRAKKLTVKLKNNTINKNKQYAKQGSDKKRMGKNANPAT